MDERIAILLFAYVGILFSIVVHECAHGVMAYWCGDDTAYRMGRITLNPIPHIDPFMSILMPAMLLYAGGPVFGGARPVPVLMQNLRNPRRDMMWVAWAGPMSNIVLSVAFALTANVLPFVNAFNPELTIRLATVLRLVVMANLFLAAFNLLPIPPLDGSKILAGLLPPQWGDALLSVPVLHGFIIILIILYTGVLGRLLSPVLELGDLVWDTFFFM